MKIVVTGATGNVGTSVLEALSRDDTITEVVGLARRLPRLSIPKCEFRVADVAEDDLVGFMHGASAVIHLAWMIQPSRDVGRLFRTNVEGSARVFRAAIAAGVPSIVHASSVGTYAAGPKDRMVDESWSYAGISSSTYSRQKAAVERRLDALEREHPQVRIVRLRPGLVFKRGAASEIKRLFLGNLVPSSLIGPRRVPVVPDTPELAFQAVHSHDVAQAYRLAAIGDIRGPVNVAADPVLDSKVIAHALDARLLRVRAKTLRRLAALTYKMRLQPSEPGWVDLALQVPLMQTRRARQELGWSPVHSSVEALLELLEGIEHKQGMSTAPLHPQGQPV